MKRIWLTLTLLMGAILFSTIVMAKTIVLRDIGTQNSHHESIVTLYLSSSAQYRTFMLRNPNRFVLDIKNTKTFRRFHISLRGTGISNYQYATHRDGVFRMVFGLNSSLVPRTRVISNPQSHQIGLQVIVQKTPSLHEKATPLIPKKYPVKKIHPVSQAPQKSVVPKTVLSDKTLHKNNRQHRDVIIVVDPGHGGKDPGATGPGGTHEKTIVLAIGKKLKHWIDLQPGFHAELTRKGDYFLTLRQRLHIARKDKADMFIAIHADIWKNKTAGGVSVFALSQKGATSEAARWLAARENESELMGGVKLNDKSHMLKSVLINLSQAATIRTSLEIGDDLIQKIKPIARLHHDRVEQAAFVVLKSPDIPSLLVETGFLSNPNEERRLKNPVYQNKLAHAIMQGIRRYFTANPPRGTWLSYWRSHPGVPHRT